MKEITTRQEKLQAKIDKKLKELNDLESGSKDKKLQKDYVGSGWYNELVETKYGWSYTTDYEKRVPYWMSVKVERIAEVKDWLKKSEKQMAKAKELDKKETDKLLKKSKEEMIIENLPECIRQWVKDSIEYSFTNGVEQAERWMKDNKNKFDNVNFFERREMPNYYDWKKTRDACWEILSNTERYRMNIVKDYEGLVIDLMNRVEKKCGKILSFSELFVNGQNLNGTISGEKGNATVETIGAGGYNIQRYHHRVLVK